MAASVLTRFPPDLPSNREWLDAQRQTEMEDWQRDWVPTVIRERTAADGAMPLACPKQVDESFDRWWAQYRTGQRPDWSVVRQAVKSRHHMLTERRYCPVHKITEHCYLSHVMAHELVAQPVGSTR